jgi:carboxyl-terminal processing protease
LRFYLKADNSIKMNNKKVQVWFPILFAIVMIVGMALGYKLKENTTGSNFFKPLKSNSLQEVLRLINAKYVDKINIDSLEGKAIEEVLKQLDPHSAYIPPVDLSQLNEEMKGSFEGIGVEFQFYNDSVHVMNVIPDGPAFKAGLLIGDCIITVNDSISITDKNIEADKIRSLLKGPGGSLVKVEIIRNHQKISKTIKRGIIPLKSCDADFMLDSITGFIHLNRFAESTYIEFMMALERLQKQGMKKLVLDLRNNGGGLLSKAVAIADEFLDEDKLVVYTEGVKSPKYEYKCRKEGLFEKGDLVVLIDESSASASEVLAGALQDWDRATIVGRRSFGKGLVQDQYTLSNGAGLRLTIARYYTPLGRNIQKPYDNGQNAYNKEIIDRLENGELESIDSLKNTGKVFTTSKGKKVYGGGGITPDYFVALDTSMYHSNLSKLYTKSTFSKFALSYYLQNNNYFKSFSTINKFYQTFSVSDTDISNLLTQARKDSLQILNFSEKEKIEIKQRLKNQIARFIWKSSGFYQSVSYTDDVIKKALEVIQ